MSTVGQEYRAEGVPVEHIEFIDNRGRLPRSGRLRTMRLMLRVAVMCVHSECIELIEKRPVGLISMMDEEGMLYMLMSHGCSSIASII